MASSSEHEQRAIEAILRDNDVYYTLALEERDFSDPFFRSVFRVIQDMLNRNLTVNLVTLADHAKDIPPSRIANLNPVTAANADYYAGELKERTRRRETETLLKDLAARVPKERDMRELIDYATAELLRIVEHRDVQLKKVKDLMLSAIEHIERIHHLKGEPEGLATGYPGLDKLLGGLRGGELVIVAARTSIGKTTFALNIAERIALAKHAVAFFSAEMSAEQIMQRMLAAAGRVNHQSVRKGLMGAADFEALNAAANRLYLLDIWLDDTPNIRFADLRNRARALKGRGVELIIVDYLTLIQYGDHRTPRYERVGELVRELKALARELNIPIIVLSQLNRAAEGQKPTLAELRQSGEVEEHSDVIIMLERERGEAETIVNVAKHRNGPTGEIQMVLIEDQTRFEEAVGGVA